MSVYSKKFTLWSMWENYLVQPTAEEKQEIVALRKDLQRAARSADAKYQAALVPNLRIAKAPKNEVQVFRNQYHGVGNAIVRVWLPCWAGFYIMCSHYGEIPAALAIVSEFGATLPINMWYFFFAMRMTRFSYPSWAQAKWNVPQRWGMDASKDPQPRLFGDHVAHTPTQCKLLDPRRPESAMPNTNY
eukprot:NODE_5660_length_684_cov_105.949731_g5637_i0.p1 GENE.NODE_5660_length_684_cov_105.949731_g5637_i0~~NODE_5660_length_684_cov_105.949731_g5637_i0.p1  ORF type:complete len:211 (-),score=43.16 NODE_5660_length_684_cov_105.949731_g5637_i0:51-614(-)